MYTVKIELQLSNEALDILASFKDLKGATAFIDSLTDRSSIEYLKENGLLEKMGTEWCLTQFGKKIMRRLKLPYDRTGSLFFAPPFTATLNLDPNDKRYIV